MCRKQIGQVPGASESVFLAVTRGDDLGAGLSSRGQGSGWDFLTTGFFLALLGLLVVLLTGELLGVGGSTSEELDLLLFFLTLCLDVLGEKSSSSPLSPASSLRSFSRN